MTAASEDAAERLFAVLTPFWGVIASGGDPDVPAATAASGAIVEATFAAAEAGVRTGQRLRDAQRACPDLRLTLADPDREARVFEPVVLALESTAPGVEVVRPGLAVLRAGGPSRFYGGEAATADVLRDAVAGAHVPQARGQVAAGVGAAGGLFAAALAARTDTLVPDGAAAAFLSGFPLSVLGRPALQRVLIRLGIRTLGQFAELPADAVTSRFGADGVAAYRLARGLDARPRAPRLPPADLAVSVEFDPPAFAAEQVMFAAKALAAQLHQRLAGLGLVADRVEIAASADGGAESARWWRHDGQLSDLAVAERCRWQLDAWTTAHRPAASDHEAADHGGAAVFDDGGQEGFRRLTLTPDGLRVASGTQLALFGPTPLPADAEAAIERLQNAFGHSAVTRPVLTGGRDPDDRIAIVPFGDLVPPTRGSGPWPGRVPDPAPATVPRTPIPALLLDATGHSVAVSGTGTLSAVPARLIVGGVERRITDHSSPWVAHERPWDPDTARRRARMQVACSDGTGFLLAIKRGTWSILAGYQ
jgi:protein ImuB